MQIPKYLLSQTLMGPQNYLLALITLPILLSPRPLLAAPSNPPQPSSQDETPFSQPSQLSRGISTLCSNRWGRVNKKAPLLAKIGSQYARVGQAKLAQQTFSEAIRLAQTTKFNFSKAGTLRDTAIALAEAGQGQLALQLAQTIENRDSQQSTLHDLASKLTEIGQFDQALQVIQAIGVDRGKDYALAELANQLARSGQISRSLQIAQSIEREGAKAEALADMAATLASSGQTELASKTFSDALKLASNAENIDDDWGKALTLADIVTIWQKQASFRMPYN
jgi:tetratricopeptide (TPR) repeat protein